MSSPTPEKTGTAHETVETRPLGVLVRSKNENFISSFPYSTEADSPGETVPEARHAEYSPTGDYFISVEGEQSSAVIRSAVDATIKVSCGGADDTTTPLKINFATFSPRGSYLLTWARPVAGVNVTNLVIYRVSDGQRLAGFHQKTFHIGFWPSIQWSDDEAIAAHVVTNTIHFFKGDSLEQPAYAKIGIPGVTKCALSHGSSPYTIAAFIPGVKGAPGKIALYSHPDEGGKQLSCRSTYRADTVSFLWNAKGTALLTLVSTNIDTTGKSYYGESEALYMDSKGEVEKRVELPKEGPTYDAAWSPTGNEFIIMYGYMPSRTTMFNDKCDPVFDFGTGGRNTISFSPHGRYVVLAGFGNLAGAVEIWDKNKMELVGRTELPCTTLFSWSPCSRYFLGATTFPRLRVDNGYRVIRFDGVLIHEHKYGDTPLHQACFRPALRGTYADPRFTSEDMIGGPVQPVGSTANGTAGKKGGVYRPPGSKGAPSSVVLHKHLEAGKVNKVAFMASVASAGASARLESSMPPARGKRIVPGMAPELVNTVPSKSAIARKKKKEKKERERLRLAAGQDASGSSDATTETAKVDVVETIDSIEAGEKKVKKLRKKLREVDTLKDEKAAGKELNADQLLKIDSVKSLEAELAKVETKIAELSIK